MAVLVTRLPQTPPARHPAELLRQPWGSGGARGLSPRASLSCSEDAEQQGGRPSVRVSVAAGEQAGRAVHLREPG